ncbi:MAG: FIST N-terminal domain-containing protein [Chthoniobacterales bacterium]
MRKAVSKLYEGTYEEEVIVRLAREFHAEMGTTTACAFVFMTVDYLPYLTDFTELLRVHGHIVEVAGCTAAGISGGGEGQESGPGFSILGLSFDDSKTHFVELSQQQVSDYTGVGFWQKEVNVRDSRGWVVLLNSIALDAEKWIMQWDAAFPGVPCVGGLASSSTGEEDFAVFHNDRQVQGLAIGFTGAMEITPILSQGCRPIGDPLPVTRAEANVIFSLGSRPAYEALESAFNSLEESEKAEAKGNLLAGLAATEYVEEFKSSDFIVKNILGADPKSGAVAIGGIPRLGQTLQYQFRSREAADLELRQTLQGAHAGQKPLASLLFSCNGRGSHFFGKPHHDASVLTEVFGNHASAGFLCNGEIGTSGGKNGIHGYTASVAFFL